MNNSIKELCYIYHKRNVLARERDRLRHKHRYLVDIKRFMGYANPSSIREHAILERRCHRLKRDLKRVSLNLRNHGDNNPTYRHSMDNEHRKLSAELSKAERELTQSQINYLQFEEKNPVPKKWRNVSAKELNMLIMKSKADVAMIKYKIMKHTQRYTDKVSKLIKETNTHPHYVCGVVRSLHKHETYGDTTLLTQTDIKNYHDEYLADRAIDKMLTEKT